MLMFSNKMPLSLIHRKKKKIINLFVLKVSLVLPIFIVEGKRKQGAEIRIFRG